MSIPDPAPSSAAPKNDMTLNEASTQTPPDPSPAPPSLTGLTPRQQQLLSAARKEIEADPHFRALISPAFQYADVTPGLDETERGYLYLRYSVPGSTPQEFWAHVSGYVAVKWRTGEVSVPLD